MELIYYFLDVIFSEILMNRQGDHRVFQKDCVWELIPGDRVMKCLPLFRCGNALLIKKPYHRAVEDMQLGGMASEVCPA